MRLRMLGIGVVLLAVLAFSAMALVSSAMASEILYLLAEWLDNGVGLTATLLSESDGEVLLENVKPPLLVQQALCSFGIVGSDGPDGASEMTEVLNLDDELVSSTPLVGRSLVCVNEENCETPKAWPVGLPFLDVMELWEEGTMTGFVVLRRSQRAGGAFGWYLECSELGVKGSEECTTTESVSSDTNVSGGVEEEESKAFTESQGLKLAICSGNKEESGVFEGKLVDSLSGGGALTTSE